MCNCSNSNPGIGNKNWSLQTANTGIANIATANSAMDGTGATTVLTAAGNNGAIVKSVTIKATQPVTAGMVRLFLEDAGGNLALYKEISVSTTPALAATPTPAPVLQTFEMKLDGELKLTAGAKLKATTQNSQSFNIIAEGLDWTYPSTVTDGCCNFLQETGLIGVGIIATANLNTDGTGAIGTIFTAPGGSSKGSMVKSVTIKAMQSTNEGMVRLFISDGTHFYLLQEVYIPQTAQSSFEPSFKQVIDLNMAIKNGYSICASTQLGQNFGISVEAIGWNYGIS